VAYSPVYDPKFRRDYRKLEESDISPVDAVLRLLVAGFPLPARCRDHKLKGQWKTYRECHARPNLLIIYRIESKQLRLARLGSHAELFE